MRNIALVAGFGFIITVLVASLAFAGPGQKVDNQGQALAQQVNKYVSQAIQPLMTCFQRNYNASKNAPDARTAEKIRADIKRCRQMEGTSATVAPPDGEGAAIRGRIVQLLGTLQTNVETLVTALQNHERAMQEKVETAQLVGYTGTTYVKKGENRAYGKDPRHRYENQIKNARIHIHNLGAEYEKIEGQLKAWVKRIQDMIRTNAERRHQEGK